MWFRKTSARRQAIREDVAEAESLSRATKRTWAQTLLVAAVFFMVASAVQFWPGELLPYRVGDLATADIRSPVSFQTNNPEKTERMREATRDTSPPLIVPTTVSTVRILNQMLALKEDLEGARALGDVPAEVRARFPAFSDSALKQFRNLDSPAYATMVRTFVTADLPAMPLVTRRDYDTLKSYHSGGRVAAMRTRGPLNENVPEIPLGQVMVAGEITPQQRAFIRSLALQDMPQFVSETIASYFTGPAIEPTFEFDPKLTTELASVRAAQVLPPSEPVLENQVIVKAGAKISQDNQRTLAEAQEQMHQQALLRNPWAAWLSGIGRILTVLLLTVAGVAYVVRMNAAGQSSRPRQGWAICALLLFSLIAARAIVGYWPQSAYLSGIAPTLLAAIVLTIAYNQRFALGMAALHGLLVVVTLGLGLDFYLALLAGAAVFCLELREIRTRGRLIEMGFFAGVAIFAAIWALGLTRLVGSVWSPWIVATDLYVVFIQSIWGAAGGMLVAMIMSAALPPVERIFNITTAMTLLELCDANKPLMRRLQAEAPGTFNHSLTVGIMAEAAGNAIGANGLLCRAGAYYHDIGKLSKPQYFIENQTAGGPNRHEKLSPAMSLLIIVGHVKDGIELAREYALPGLVQQFIGEHHGTTLVEYFFHAARKRKEQEGDYVPEVSEAEFRYPGPKPQTRETAIVMICDGCESVVRSIEEPTPGRIETAVHNMISKRLMDGQFNECDLTLRQLSVIEETLTRTLAGIHHGRVAYPPDAARTPSPLSQPA